MSLSVWLPIQPLWYTLPSCPSMFPSSSLCWFMYKFMWSWGNAENAWTPNQSSASVRLPTLIWPLRWRWVAGAICLLSTINTLMANWNRDWFMPLLYDSSLSSCTFENFRMMSKSYVIKERAVCASPPNKAMKVTYLCVKLCSLWAELQV